MASVGRNMQLSNIAIKYTLSDIVVFDFIPFPTSSVVFTVFTTNFCPHVLIMYKSVRYMLIKSLGLKRKGK